MYDPKKGLKNQALFLVALFMVHNKKSMIIMYGPTGVGKTDCSIELANRLGGEIVNMDMGALYTPLSIGTAKPDWQSSSVPHHLFDVADSPRFITVVQYRELLLGVIEQIWQRGNIPILVGGSGFYLKSLFFPPHGAPIAASDAYTHIPENKLWQHLMEIDPVRAKAINPQDLYRVKRALDIWYSTGKKPSDHAPVFQPLAPFALYFLKRDRAELYARIDERVLTMIDAGWIAEVQSLRNSDWEPFIHEKKIIGYDDILAYLATDQTDSDKKMLVEKIQKKTRNYAKRQFTFWRSLQKDLQDALAEYTDSNLVAQSYIGEVDVARKDSVAHIETTLKSHYLADRM